MNIVIVIVALAVAVLAAFGTAKKFMREFDALDEVYKRSLNRIGKMK
jgi:hypothetical protein